MEDIFAVILLVDLQKSHLNIAKLSDKLSKLSQETGQQIHIHDEKIIQAMHRI